MSNDALPNRLLPAHGHYRELKSFQKAEIVYNLTYQFCERYLRRGDRTVGQMVQAGAVGEAEHHRGL